MPPYKIKLRPLTDALGMSRSRSEVDLVLAIPHTRVFGIWGGTGFGLLAPVQFGFLSSTELAEVEDPPAFTSVSYTHLTLPTKA